MILRNYLFGQVSGIYQQYTTDHSVHFLKQLCKNCLASNQIAIHRDGNLIYYAYAHKKNETEVYGICIVCGEVCLNLKWLYDSFGKTLEDAANKGVLFCYDQDGKIRMNVTDLSSEAAEVDCFFRDIKEYVSKRQSYWESLPPEDFSISKESKITLAFNEDDKGKITDAIRHYHNVIVTMDNTTPSSFARTVERLNSENAKLQEEKNTLETEIGNLTKQKKQYKWVVILSILVVLGLITISLFNQNVNDLKQTISDRENSIDSLNNVVSDRDNTIYNQKQEILSVKANLRIVNEELNESKKLIEDISMYSPISASEMEVKNESEDYGESIYSSNTTYIYPKLTVHSLIEGSIDLYTKFYRPDGSLSRSSTSGVSPVGFSYKNTVSLSKNQTTTVYLSGWGGNDKGHWTRGTYRIEVWYNNVCIKAKTFTIY